jgi:hypothetical protein
MTGVFGKCTYNSACTWSPADADLETHTETYFETLKFYIFNKKYIIFLLLCVVNNRSKFKMNSDVYNINTKEKFDFLLTSSNVSPYKNSTLLA